MNPPPLDPQDEPLVSRIIIKLRLYAEFLNMAGVGRTEIQPDTLFQKVLDEIERVGITDETRTAAISWEVIERIACSESQN